MLHAGDQASVLKARGQRGRRGRGHGHFAGGLALKLILTKVAFAGRAERILRGIQ
jgi:hypothetical protein